MKTEEVLSEVFSGLLSGQTICWFSTALAILVACDTTIRLWTERHRFFKEDLNDQDRSLAWRLVLFLFLPLLTFIDMRATDVAAGLFGGFLNHPEYGFVWYSGQLVFDGPVSDAAKLAVLFAGEAAQLSLALLIMPAMLLRPHPFLATLLGYAVAFTLGLNLIVDPALSLAGMTMAGSERWSFLFASLQNSADATSTLSLNIVIAHGVLLSLYLLCLINSRARLVFSDLSRPQISEELKQCLLSWQAQPSDPNLTLKLGLLYLRAGITRRAHKMLRRLREEFPSTIQTSLLNALLCFHERRYKASRKAFIETSEFPLAGDTLRASLLAAAACAAFAEGDDEGALNLAERALEFEDASITARMVKVDAFLHQGKKEQAAQEILVAMHMGLDFDLKDKVPLDIEETFAALADAVSQPHEAVHAQTKAGTETPAERSK